MGESASPPAGDGLRSIEPGERLVVLARTLHARDPEEDVALREAAGDRARFGRTCLGHALYRHRSIHRGDSDVPAWSHLELSYFHSLVPADVVRGLVFEPRPAGAHLLRAEILLTTPGAFVMPSGWRGSTDRPGRRASLEYIDVRPAHLAAYRDIMRRCVGPAAARHVAAGEIGTIRAMETAAVLRQDPALATDWNQIHLCELDADGFEGFGAMFEAALRALAPDGAAADVFAGLGAMRAIPRWTFNDPVVEADLALARPETAAPPGG